MEMTATGVASVKHRLVAAARARVVARVRVRDRVVGTAPAMKVAAVEEGHHQGGSVVAPVRAFMVATTRTKVAAQWELELS